MLTCKFRKKILSHILLYVFCLYSLRMHHDYLFRRSFESVRPQFFSGKLGLERTGAEGAPAPSSPPPPSPTIPRTKNRKTQNFYMRITCEALVYLLNKT